MSNEHKSSSNFSYATTLNASKNYSVSSFINFQMCVRCIFSIYLRRNSTHLVVILPPFLIVAISVFGLYLSDIPAAIVRLGCVISNCFQYIEIEVGIGPSSLVTLTMLLNTFSDAIPKEGSISLIS